MATQAQVLPSSTKREARQIISLVGLGTIYIFFCEGVFTEKSATQSKDLHFETATH